MSRTLKYWQAISEGTVQGMERDANVYLMGIGVTYPSAIFGTTLEATRRFAPTRVLDTPASENALTCIAVGSAAMGKRPLMVHNRNDFMFLALDALVNLASKWRYMYGGASTAPVVVRGLIGKGWGQGATHSQSLQSVLAHFPGLVVAMPSTPADAKGLLLSALRSSSSVVLLEHRSLYDVVGEVPEEIFEVPFGRARIAREGADLTIVATSYLVGEALVAAEALHEDGIEVEVIDPRTIRPLDESAILRSLEKTGRLVVADTSWAHCGFSSEIAALAAEKGFRHLKAPVRRVTNADCPCPVSWPLEKAFYANASTIAQAAKEVLGLAPVLGGVRETPDTFLGPY